MAGPIRTLLEKRPLRNAVRSLLGMRPIYGINRMDTVEATDSMQGADLDARPRRLLPRRDIDNAAYQRQTAAQPPVAPSPEARAISLARAEDSQRRQAVTRQGEGITAQPAPSQPRPPETGGFADTGPATPAATQPQSVWVAEAQRFRDRAELYRAEADRVAATLATLTPKSDAYAPLTARRQFLEQQVLTADTLANQQIQLQAAEQAAQERMREETRRISEQTKAQFPSAMPTDNAQDFMTLVRTMGPIQGAAYELNARYARAQVVPNTEEASYKAQLAQNINTAMTAVFSERIQQSAQTRRNPFQPGEPLIVDLAVAAKGHAPDDPAARQRYIMQIMSGVQQQSRLTPEASRVFAALLTKLMEDEVAKME